MAIVPIISISRNLIIVYIEDHPKAIILLRMARKRAEERGWKWRAVFIETPAYIRHMEDGAHERMLRLLAIAEQMGGETAHLAAETAEKGLTSLLSKEADRIALVIIGSVKTEGKLHYLHNWSRLRMVRQAGKYAPVEIIPLAEYQYYRSLSEIFNLRDVHPAYLLYALLSVGLAYMGALFLEWVLPPALFRINNENIALLFMIACAFSAGRYGLLPGLMASVASFFAINYYFTVPYHTFKIWEVTDMLNMGLFLSAALLISLFTSYARDCAQKAFKREMKSQALFTLYRMASESFSREQALEKLHEKLERMLDVDIAFFLPETLSPGAERIMPACPSNLILNEADRKALNNCWLNLHATGVAAPFNYGTQWRFEPMIAPSGEIGVLGARLRKKMHMDIWLARLITAIADQTATVLEHIKLEQSMEETRISEEREKLRSMLLSSISHDFKTPIAGIIGALSVHRSLGERLPQSKRDELIEAAIEEAQRLDSFITNILDMTRLESGNIRFKPEWYDMGDLIENVTKRMQHRLRQHEVVIRPLPRGIEVYMDVMMTGQVLQNILDNACKYTAAGTHIEIGCAIEESDGFFCKIHDAGKGLPPEKLKSVFDKYERLHKKDMQVAGTGLGLAISRAVMEAQGGWINAANHPKGGAEFTFFLPQWRRVEAKEQERISL